jgi:hypothetical protein
MMRGKKGFTYVLTMSLVLAVIVLVFLTGIEPTYQDDTDLVRSRVLAMDDFVTNLENDINRATYIASFRALLSLEDVVASQGQFLNDTEMYFVEAFVNGTIQGSPAVLMNASTFSDYLLSVNDLGSDLGFFIDLQVRNVSLSHSDPWHIAVAIDLDIYLEDALNVATWNTTERFITQVPIYDLRDPLYSSFTNNRVLNTIRPYPAIPLVNASNDTAQLVAFLNDSYYVASEFAPTFLQRFENNMTPSPNGIESVVNIAEISAQEIAVYPSRVKIDFMYFNDISDSDVICGLENVPSPWSIILPDSRISPYGLTGINYTTTC